jgi:hypothetical protein
MYFRMNEPDIALALAYREVFTRESLYYLLVETPKLPSFQRGIDL